MDRAARETAAALDALRWDGRPGRTEVWYDTITDPATGTGIWLHHELVAPTGGEGAYVHGWAAVFPPGAAPGYERFGPLPAPGRDAPWFEAGGVVARTGERRGTAGPLAWDLRYDDAGAPLRTFPAWAWRREVLPGVHLVTAPAAAFSGTVRGGGVALDLAGAPGAAARIYGHGSAETWAWLHAGLGGGDVCEIVAAVSRRPGLRRLRPLPFVQLRLAGHDWPARPLAAAPRFRARIGLPRWEVTGGVGGRRLHVEVTQPEDRCVAVAYRDPDGATATCTNTERADAAITLERRAGGRWVTEREWRLDGTAHAEVGGRP